MFGSSRQTNPLHFPIGRRRQRKPHPPRRKPPAPLRNTDRRRLVRLGLNQRPQFNRHIEVNPLTIRSQTLDAHGRTARPAPHTHTRTASLCPRWQFSQRQDQTPRAIYLAYQSSSEQAIYQPKHSFFGRLPFLSRPHRTKQGSKPPFPPFRNSPGGGRSAFRSEPHTHGASRTVKREAPPPGGSPPPRTPAVVHCAAPVRARSGRVLYTCVRKSSRFHRIICASRSGIAWR